MKIYLDRHELYPHYTVATPKSFDEEMEVTPFEAMCIKFLLEVSYLAHDIVTDWMESLTDEDDK